MNLLGLFGGASCPAKNGPLLDYRKRRRGWVAAVRALERLADLVKTRQPVSCPAKWVA